MKTPQEIIIDEMKKTREWLRQSIEPLEKSGNKNAAQHVKWGIDELDLALRELSSTTRAQEVA